MAQPRTSALQMDAERAGLAWACPFSSSAEFEAAVISARRRAGAYGPTRSPLCVLHRLHGRGGGGERLLLI